MLRAIVVGTGTDVGKTHVTCCLLAHARAAGIRAVAWKPISTGVEAECGDARRHAAASGAEYVSPAFAYRRAVSPHVCARDDGRPIDLARIAARVDEIAGGARVVLIESAGGLVTPLGDATTNLDLVKTLSPAAVLLVAPDRLGALHDVGAAVLAARSAGIAITAVVLSAPTSPDASTGTNGEELRRLGFPLVGTFPRALVEDSGAVSARVWAALLRPPGIPG